MANFRISAKKEYLAKMERTYNLDLDEAEFLTWLNGELADVDVHYFSIKEIDEKKLRAFIGNWIDHNAREDFDVLLEGDEVEGYYSAQTIAPIWDIDIEESADDR